MRLDMTTSQNTITYPVRPVLTDPSHVNYIECEINAPETICEHGMRH